MTSRLHGLALSTLALGALALGIAAPAASATDYPNKAVRIIVPYPAGGTTDMLGRLIADGLRKKWGQSFVVENRTGAGTVVGTQMLTRSPTDGYTLLLATATASTTAFAPLLYSNPGFTIDQIVGVAMIGRSPLVLVVPPQSPFNAVSDLVTYGNANRDKLNLATQRAGATSHLTAELFRGATGISYAPIHYQGSTPGLNGETNLFFDGVSTSAPLINSGKIKGLAVTSDARMPNTPTMKKIGLPDVVVYAWYGMLAPAGTPDDIRQMLNTEINAIIDAKDVHDRLFASGAEVSTMSIAAFEMFYTEEREMWRKVIAQLNIKLDWSRAGPAPGICV